MIFNLFKKRKQVQETKKVFVPDGKKMTILRAYDDFRSAPRDQDAALRYKFWSLAEEACPEVGQGSWVARMYNGTRPYFEKYPEED